MEVAWKSFLFCLLTVGAALADYEDNMFANSLKPLPALGPLQSCPPPTPVQVCDPTCTQDDQCAGVYKCCPTACGGAICTLPVTLSRNRRVKGGSCPASKSGPWICSNMCSNDGDCRGNMKCCPNRCGALVCTNPE